MYSKQSDFWVFINVLLLILSQTGSPSSSFNTTKCTGKRPRVLDSHSEAEFDESIPPLPPSMTTLDELRRSSRVPPRKKLKISKSFLDESIEPPLPLTMAYPTQPDFPRPQPSENLLSSREVAVQEMVTCPGESLTDAGSDELLDWVFGDDTTSNASGYSSAKEEFE